MFDIVDTHAHLDMDNFDSDIDSVINRAKLLGINQIINPGVTLNSIYKSIELAKKYPNTVFIAISIHPQNANEWNEFTYRQLLELNNDSVVAIGETGLDFYYDYTPKDIQIQVFKEHIKLAKELGKPLIIHNRDSHEIILDIMKSENISEVGGVMHCFSGDYEFASKCIELGLYISFTGILTFKKAKELQDIAVKVPIERILLETDSPYLAPEPYRGKRNEPSYIIHIANKLAMLKGISVDKVIEITTNNARKLFKGLNWKV